MIHKKIYLTEKREGQRERENSKREKKVRERDRDRERQRQRKIDTIPTKIYYTQTAEKCCKAVYLQLTKIQ